MNRLIHILIPLLLILPLFCNGSCKKEEGRFPKREEAAALALSQLNQTCFGRSPNLFSDSFEGYSVGVLPNRDPWSYHAGPAALINVDVIGQGCAVGAKCLKVKMATRNNDPFFYAIMHAKTGCIENFPLMYMQFFVKYTHPISEVLIYATNGTQFELEITSTLTDGGKLVVPNRYDNNNPYVIVTAGHISPGIWYRIEAAINQPSASIVNVRVYEGNAVTPVAGSTLLRDMKVWQHWIPDSVVGFQYHSTDYFSQPIEPNLENYSFFIDDFAISDNPSILRVGF